MFTMGVRFFRTVFLVINMSVLFRYLNSLCSDKEYEYKNTCCPKCMPGLYVQEHCTQDAGTSCHPCDNGTYQDNLNGDEECFKCTICEEGTYETKACSSTQDTVCDCTEGFHCTDITTDGCRKCLKHRSCPLGQKVIREGAYRRDTECGPCANGSCLSEEPSEKGTKCTPSTTNSESNQAIVILSVIVALLVLLCIFLLWKNISKYFDLALGFLSKKTDNIGNPNLTLQKSVQEQEQDTKNMECVTFSVEESRDFSTSVSDSVHSKLWDSGTLKKKNIENSELKMAHSKMKPEVQGVTVRSTSSVEPFGNNIY
ncbi:tumor necrosis factor receptor superfamily member 14-like isoform X2 [Pristis pectinata]|uniref:tumor necrosis factor receptor superfamily member 14-like isoform X2 n=1 Tax=Pristis pectinata TaxID=685728 RepID=UPI00223DEC2E|nr:tumor necrosis factor receptor superfamily member 14-like isoform X2 [Pristis pectinata]